MTTFNPALLALKLGQTLQQQIDTCQAIKDAMTQLMIHRWEAGTAGPDDNSFAQATTLYMEAHTHAFYLKENVATS